MVGSYALPQAAGDAVEVGQHPPQVGGEVVGHAALAQPLLEVMQGAVTLGARALIDDLAEDGGAVEDLGRALQGLARRERLLDLVAARLRVMAASVGPLPAGPGDQHATGGDAEVIHEVAPDQIVLVADAACDLTVARQEEARILDPAQRQHEQPGATRACLPARFWITNAAARPSAAQLDVDQSGVQPEIDPRHRLELGPILLAEPGRRRAEAEHPRHQPVGRQRQQPAIGLEPGRVVAARAEIEDRVRLGIERLEIGPADRPAAVGDPRPGQEIELVQGRAHAAPMIGRAAEEAQAGRVELEVWQAQIGPPVEILHLGLVTKAAALQDHDPVGARAEGQRKRDPRGPGPGDAEVAGDLAVTVVGMKIPDHGHHHAEQDAGDVPDGSATAGRLETPDPIGKPLVR